MSVAAIKEANPKQHKATHYQVVRKRHVVEQRSEFHFAVLGPNPDRGKEGVCYSGEYFTVCITDGLEEAKRIAKGLDLLNMIDALSETPVLER